MEGINKKMSNVSLFMIAALAIAAVMFATAISDYDYSNITTVFEVDKRIERIDAQAYTPAKGEK